MLATESAPSGDVMDKRTSRISLWTGLVTSIGGLLVLAASLPWLLLAGLLVPIVVLGGLSDAPPPSESGSPLGAWITMFLECFVGGLWFFNLGMAVLVAREHDLIKYSGKLLRGSLIASLVWTAVVLGTSFLLWNEGGLGRLMLIPAAAGLGFCSLIRALTRCLSRKPREIPSKPAKREHEWYAGPQGADGA